MDRGGAAAFLAVPLKQLRIEDLRLLIGQSVGLKYLVPIEFAVMFGWWSYQAAFVYDPGGWWKPWHTYSIGTCVVQWAVALLLLIKRAVLEAGELAGDEGFGWPINFTWKVKKGKRLRLKGAVSIEAAEN